MADRLNALDREIEAAKRRGRRIGREEPRAESARYARETGCIHVDLTNGCSFAFPAALVEGLSHASADQLSEIEILGLGLGLHWEALDMDVSVPELLAGVFGTRAWMSRMQASKAGSASSPAKAAAARRNGAKGGRPKASR